MIDEWNRLAHKEVQDMTTFGVPGVYTHDFYDGWAPNYMFWIANMRNSIGRFYETQGSGDASTPQCVRTSVDRQLVPHEHAAARGGLGHPQQREPPAERDPDRA